MDKAELLSFKTRLNSVIKECREIIKDIDVKLTAYDSPSSEADYVILAGQTFDFAVHKETVTSIVKRKDIAIYIVGLKIKGAIQTYQFHLIKGNTITPISISINSNDYQTVGAFTELLYSNWKPKTGHHLKSLINKATDNTVIMTLLYPPNQGFFLVNVNQTNVPNMPDVRHRNVTYLFPWLVYAELSATQQMALMRCNQTLLELY